MKSCCCCWHELLFAQHSSRDARLFTCVRAWRCAVLKRKHRFRVATAREWRQVHFFEQELPLHAAVVSLDHRGTSLHDAPFELVTLISAMFPGCAELPDECRRAPLHYALEQHWCLDKLSWLVDRSLAVVLDKDTEGLSLLMHAVAHACPDEMTVWMAVAVARACLGVSVQLLDDRLFDSARRYCERMLHDHFAGVPEFPLAHCRAILSHSLHSEDDVVTAIEQIQTIWRGFIDKWGYYGAPIIQRDLPTQLTAAIDSFVQVSVVAQGEPLTYQWFRDDAPIEMATQAFLYISQSIQPHNAGRYHCQVSNWQGTIVSTAMRVDVVDDQTEADPSQKYRVPRELLRPDDAVNRVRASTGALLHHRSTGVRLLLPPRCFRCVDARGAVVSDSHGLQVVIRALAPEPEPLALHHRDELVSCVVEILPHTVPAFDRPVTLLLPHCASASDSSSELVVVRVSDVTGDYEDVQAFPHIAASSRPSASGGSCRQVCVEIQALGSFAVVARSLGASYVLEQAKLLFVRPAVLASAAFSTKVVTSLWIARDRPDALAAVAAAIDRHVDLEPPLPCASERTSSMQRLWAVDTLDVQVRRGNIVCVQVGERERIAYEWAAPGDTQAGRESPRRHGRAPSEQVSVQSSLTRLGYDCLASAVALYPSEVMETASVPDDPLPPFCALTLDVAVHKRLAYGAKRLNVADFFAKPNALAPSSISTSVVLSEAQWRVLIPVAHDAPRVPSTPRLARRSAAQVVLEFDAATQVVAAGPASGSSRETSQRSLLDVQGRVSDRASRSMGGDDDDEAESDRFAERHEGEREFTPYFYAVEMATFSETFWQRYDQTWWFDKTKTEIINGMYKVVHAGVEPFAVIATDAFAGCFRVAQCSIDRFGGYSEPMLLEPLLATPGATANGLGDTDSPKRGGGLVRKLRSLQSSSSRAATPSPDGASSAAIDCSTALLASTRRIDALLSTVYAGTALDHFHALVGFPNTGVESVATSLEARRTKCCASNLELALLLAALQGLDARVRCVRLRASGAALWVAKLRLVERLVPELDCYPVEFFATVTTELHALVLRCSDVLRKLSDSGWLGHFLLGEWFETELRSVLSHVVELLTRESGGGASLRGAKDIAQDLSAFLALQETLSRSSGADLDRIAADRMQKTFALQLLGTYDRLQSRDAKHAVALQLVRALELVPPLTEPANATPAADVEALVLDELALELEAASTRDALATLRARDSLEQHVRLVAPAPNELCARVPVRIAVRFGPLVTSIDTSHVVRVVNATLGNATVHGAAAFSLRDGLLTFTPTVALERKSTYAVKVRCDVVETCLGAALSGVWRFQFTTP